MSSIEIEHLKYRYPNTKRLSLDDINLSIEKGEFIGIVGENGAGKSTLGQAIIGLVPRFYNGAYGGKVLVKDILVEKQPVEEMCEHVGLIFQNPFNQLSGAKETVYGEVCYGVENLGIPREEIEERVEKVLKQLDIWEYRERNPFELSGGQMQRVAIASILVMQPEIIILDEPTSQLDPQGSEEVFSVVDQLTEMGITIIMIEQKLEKLAAYSDRVILMQDGKVIDFDTPEKIFSRDDLEQYGIQPRVYYPGCKTDLSLFEESYGILLRDPYADGRIYSLAVPDAYPDFYCFPAEVLSRIRQEFPVRGIWLEGPARISLFVYDNDTVVVYPYVMEGTQRERIRLHVKGARALTAKGWNGETEISPLYERDGEAVFDLIAMPGRYAQYRILR